MSGFNRGSAARSSQPSGHTPTCRPCTAGEHERCPTALNLYAESGFTSDYRCPCFYEDEDMHEDAVTGADAEHRYQQDNRWDSVGGQFDW